MTLMYVNTDSLNVRSGPGLTFPIRYTLPRGTDITVDTAHPKIVGGWTWVERLKYPGLWVALELLTDHAPAPVTYKVFGIHWSQDDNGEMLDLLTRANLTGRPVPWLTILGGVNNVDIVEVMRRSPRTKIFYRQFYPWGGSSTTNMSPPDGWGRATYEQGRSFARWYMDVLCTNMRAFIKKGNNVWHVGFNEPTLGSDTGDPFIAWHRGYSETLDAAGLWHTAFNFPPGYPDYPGGIHEGNRFWNNPNVHSYIAWLYSLGNYINLHEGDIFHARNFLGEHDSLRHRKIRPWLPPSIRNITIASTEYYLYETSAMDPMTFAHNLGEGNGLLMGDGVMPSFWVYKVTPGFEGDDMYNKINVYASYLGA